MYNNNNMTEKAERQQYLIDVYRDTISRYTVSNFLVHKSIKYNYDSTDFNIMYGRAFESPAKIIVENIDTFELARKLKENVMVLNLASHINAGGGVENGAIAQEEDLFRKSNYFQTLNQNFYPLAMNEVVYSPLVYIIKDNNYRPCTPMPVACLAVAAILNPKVIADNGVKKYENFSDFQIMKKKIEMIFKVAIKHNHHNLVLGALGCGAFYNPPDQVAYIFKSCIEKYKYNFKTISFAILSGPGNNNFNVFNKILK